MPGPAVANLVAAGSEPVRRAPLAALRARPPGEALAGASLRVAPAAVLAGARLRAVGAPVVVLQRGGNRQIIQHCARETNME